MLSLIQIKKHLNIDENYNGDDEYLQQLNRVADDVVEKHIIQIKLSKLKKQ